MVFGLLLTLFLLSGIARSIVKAANSTDSPGKFLAGVFAGIVGTFGIAPFVLLWCLSVFGVAVSYTVTEWLAAGIILLIVTNTPTMDND